MAVSESMINGISILTIENDLCKVSVAPALGGKILSVYNKKLAHEFIWTNSHLSLQAHEPGTDYDSNFIGGIDELLPNDIAETIDSIDYPDHGELWTTKLGYSTSDEDITVSGLLNLSGLHYRKTVRLDPHSPVVHLDYHIENLSGARRNFLWKLHAPVNIEAGDRLVTDARHAKVVDPAYSRFTDTREFSWPSIQNTDASIVPASNGSVDFFYLYDGSPDMHMSVNSSRYLFGYSYDHAVFPYQWYFASYGGFMDHYTAIIEPCTAMPISVNEARQKNQCSVLEPGGSLSTMVRIYAGEQKNFIAANE